MTAQSSSTIDVDALAAGYGRLLDGARSSRFSAPRDGGEWTAERVLAHVAVNDRLLAATVAEVLHGRAAAYDNRPATRTEYLDAVAHEAGSWAGLVDELARGARVLVALAAELGDLAGTVIHARIEDGGEVALDADVTVARLFRAQVGFHLPAHTDQLIALADRVA
jgi:hypothetical protein